MRIGIPIAQDNGLDSEISGHFGRAEYFIIVELKPDYEKKKVFRENDIETLDLKFSVIKNPVEHACASLVDLLMGNNIEILVVEGIGGRPFALLKQNGVKVYTGAFGTIKEVLRDFLNELLEELEIASCGHDDHQHHHH